MIYNFSAAVQDIKTSTFVKAWKNVYLMMKRNQI